MRYKAVATDAVDFSRALRLEMGLDPAFREFEPVMVAAVPHLDGEATTALSRIVAEAGDPALIWGLDVPHKLDRPARIVAFLPSPGSLMVMTGLTLWAGSDPSLPLIVVPPSGGSAFTVTAQGLLQLPSIPLGIEGSLEPGIERACDRLTKRMLAIASLRDLLPMPA
ncbi:hypothetical protein [Sphingomonas sp. TX0522]|jgi:hypothetical protein|uniref:hypothetical protein n=1 Tax=Sphingomonas sp. TX0522 TaxID=2479205 RepID=UPI0018E0474C|nr:hypothetical protein [Sphingomonas sp. TX0522]MBI0532032.1 hypothetical protein [Sphingomonas sp. TX0522]